MGNFISGNISKIIYQSNSGPYKVGIFRVRETNDKELESYINKNIGFTGSFNEINSDVDYVFYGYLVNHPKYGIQYNVESYEVKPPSDKDSLVLYLSSGMFPGIGEKTAKRIVDKFLHSTFESQIRYQDFFLAFYLEFNKEKVLSLINDYKKYGGEIGMWGLGKNGIQFMQFCKDNQVVMDYVIDQDCNKQKLSHYYTTEIITPDKLNQKIKLIIVSSMGIYNEVKRYVTEKEYEINIIDLCTYLNIV